MATQTKLRHSNDVRFKFTTALCTWYMDTNPKQHRWPFNRKGEKMGKGVTFSYLEQAGFDYDTMLA